MIKYILVLVSLHAGIFCFAQKTITTDDVWKHGIFRASGVHGLKSMNDGEHYTTQEGQTIYKYSYKTGKIVDTVLNSALIKYATGVSILFSSYSFSDDEKKVLLKTQSEKIYRHSTRAKFYIYNLENSSLSVVAEEKVRYATLSPAGDKVAYVKENNLFIKDFTTENTTQVTLDGKLNHIINGATDWVYEEEFAMSTAFFWSPDGKHIAYFRFDESEVPEFSMDVYGKSLYPTQNVFKYPKAGEPNSKVSAYVYSLENNKSTQVLQNEKYEYIPRIKWTQDPNKVVIYTLNRYQNQLQLILVDVLSYQEKLLLTEEDEAYVEVSDDIRFLKDGNFIWSSEKSGFMHLYLYDKNGKQLKQITSGDWEVTKFYGINEDLSTLYFQSNEGNIAERKIYSINTKGTNKKVLSKENGTNNAEFSTNFLYFINTHSAYKNPPFVSLNNANGDQIRILKSNDEKREALNNYFISDKEFFTLKTESGQELSAWMMKPVNFDKTKKHPVLMFLYGGPGSQKVLNNYDANNDMWYQTLTAKGYIIVCVDNRGTGGKGRDFKKITYLQLGKFEVEDQIESAKYLGNLPYVDKSRIGIWGWSYGGYMSSNCLFQGNDVFKMAIAVAPVTNWRFYDNIYTERYMRTPQENASGYEENSPINHVKKLKGNFLLIHGTGDDNVHVQNSMRMAAELVKAEKQFSYFVYPDQAHSLNGGGAKLHVYKLMEEFILRSL